MKKTNQNAVFICYSRADARSLTRLRVHLRPFERLGQITAWSDLNLKPGQKWRSEIASAVQGCRVAILLVSADFLASDFIANNELPPLLNAEKDRGITVLPVVLRPCALDNVPGLSEFQSFTDPNRPLQGLSDNAQEQIWLSVARRVRDVLAEHRSSALMGPQHFAEERPDSFDTDYLAEGIDPPEAVRDFRLYQYHHIDVLGYMRSAEDVLHGYERKREFLEALRHRFLDAGWEGDGTIQGLWFPPFVGAGIEDTYGVATWHVKQSNNGTSFIASPVDLPFERLREQQF